MNKVYEIQRPLPDNIVFEDYDIRYFIPDEVLENFDWCDNAHRDKPIECES